MRLALLAAVPLLAATPALAAPDYPDYSDYPDSPPATVTVTPRVDSTTTIATPRTSSEDMRVAANAARESYYRNKLEAARAQAQIDSAIADRDAAQDRAAADREAAEDAEEAAANR